MRALCPTRITPNGRAGPARARSACRRRFAPYCATSTPGNRGSEMEAVTEPLIQGGFSMELSQDQRDVRDWVRGFARDVVRPAAAEWDEREETPWPLIQEAAKI